MNLSTLGVVFSLLPLLGCSVGLCFDDQRRIGQCHAFFIWMGLLLSPILAVALIPLRGGQNFLGFQQSSVVFLLMMLIFFISAVVHQFSIKFFEGRANYRNYFAKISFLTSSLLLMVQSDNFFLMLLFLTICNALLVSLIGLEPEWSPCMRSALLTRDLFSWVTILLSIAMLFLYLDSGSLSISAWNGHSRLLWYMGVVPLVIASLIQSSLFPFHRPLASSLNAPSTVSAFMHAGLVNGGGIILIKCHSLIENSPLILELIFIAGFLSVILGSAWKLIQTSVKSSLVYSTIGQMGFMIMQCGLGLFSAAFVHLIWHSLFKAFLFLRSGSVLHEVRTKESQGIALPSFVGFSLCALPATWLFAKTAGYSTTPATTSFVLVFFAFIAVTQLLISITEGELKVGRTAFAVALSLIFAGMYGLSVGTIERYVFESVQSADQPLSFVKLISLGVVALFWAFQNLRIKQAVFESELWKRCYVMLLNSSQPQSDTLNL